jgi:fructose-1,6-bisphosphatase/inositol monophosphatase family enzyme
VQGLDASMATASPSSERLLQGAVEAARAGGAVLVEGLRRPREVELKSQRASIVTPVDLAAQREITRLLTDRFPEHAVLGEEGDGGVEAGEGTVTWLVDPVDGTSNYVHGVPFACTSVAARDPDGVVVGAIYEPFRQELFTAVRAGGAWIGRDRLSVSATDSLSRSLVATGVQTDDSPAIEAFGRRIVALSRRCRAVRCLGSPALALAYVAAGRVDAFLERDSTYAWDVGAGALLITEAGGRIEDLDGGPLNLGPGLANVLASNGHIHAALAELVRAAEAAAP